jgi:membrane fusion protein (multidrug efflux system)
MGAVRNNAIAVPQVAVMDSPQGKYVYVVGKDKEGKDVAEVRIVQLGEWSAANGVNLWIVDSGLKPGDVVIVDGVAKLRPGAPIQLGPPPGAPGAPAAPGKDAPQKSAPAKPAAKS